MRRALFSDRVGQMRSAYRRLSCACRHPIKPEEPSRKCRSESSKFRLENRSPATIEIVAGCSLPPAGAALPRTARYDDVRFPRGWSFGGLARDSRAFRFSVLGVSHEVAQRNFGRRTISYLRRAISCSQCCSSSCSSDIVGTSWGLPLSSCFISNLF